MIKVIHSFGKFAIWTGLGEEVCLLSAYLPAGLKGARARNRAHVRPTQVNPPLHGSERPDSPASGDSDYPGGTRAHITHGQTEVSDLGV